MQWNHATNHPRCTALIMNATSDQFVTQFGQLLHRIDDAVVKFEIEDGKPIIVDANHAFRDLFSPDMKRVIGLPLNDLIVPAEREAEAKEFDERTADGKSNVAFVKRAAADGEKTFLYRGIPYGDSQGFAIYTDVTDKVDDHDELLDLF
ncbi:hypothetical protein EGH24_06510 [Halonotius terrestris]|uniref:PAS fold-4 domain-containing protein n=2 Tax=Halonotius terrestris TaxID=2487750 RepID=A0A8J8PB00_9EURY|nr:hypothetical protein EGH24_06510 [Halonotius terrestris]